jgi:signal transduction histidine kinase
MRPIHFLGLRTRIYLLLAGLVAITLSGGGVTFWYTYRMERLLGSITGKDLALFHIADDLETSLIQQKGFVSYYFMDRDPRWLVELAEYRKDFKEILATARKEAASKEDLKLLDRIEAEFETYAANKDRVIELYNRGETEAGVTLHRQTREDFSKLISLTEQFKDRYQQKVWEKKEQSVAEAGRLRLAAASAVGVSLVLFTILASVLAFQVLDPIRRLALETGRGRNPGEPANEVATLSRRVKGLIEDRNLTLTELERSRERLLQSEKMALVGKLAAEVAHTIRNPLTSIKMRLFSLERTLDLSATQQEDLDVISQEMRHLDNIVKNFLEFARPPKLKMQACNISDIVDLSVQLLEKRFEHQRIRLERRRGVWLPQVYADPDAIKEVLVNLLLNACDAMKEGGSIAISEEEGIAERMGRVVLVRVSDTGPGIPMHLWEKVWEPFFSTKEDGTGLGLAIALRTVEEHGGRLELRPSEGRGATFVMTLPVHTEES